MKVTLKSIAASGILLLIILSSIVSNASEKETVPFVTHVVAEDETAWFLASVYYGKGSEYEKLLASNHLKRPEDMKEGMTLRIENPKYSKKSAHFSERYSKLWQQRQKALGLSIGETLPASKIVIPTERILDQDKTPKLPFAEGKAAGKSASDWARDELHKEDHKGKHGE